MSNYQLAIEGGSPTVVGSSFLWPKFESSVQQKIDRAVNEALRDGSWGHYHGRWTEQLVDLMGSKLDNRSVMLCSSGTISVELALRGLGVRADDEVILAGYDFPGNFRAIEAIGALPVLVDVIPNGWTMDAQQLPLAITPNTKAIIVSHLHGQLADITKIRQLIEADHPNVRILEDACQTPGGMINGQPIGTLGDISTFSFGGSKPLTAGRGGAIVAADDAYLQRIKVYAERGNDAFPLSQLQAATLAPQIERLDTFVNQRQAAAQQFIQSVGQLNAAIGKLEMLVQTNDTAIPCYYKIPFFYRHPESRPLNRNEVIAALSAEGIPIGQGFRGFINRSKRRCRKPLPLDHCRRAIEETVLVHHPVLDADLTTRSQILEAFNKVLTVVGQRS